MVKTHRVSGEVKIGSMDSPGSCVSISLTCNKGDSNESEALEAMKSFIGFLGKMGIRHELFMRNTDEEDMPDGVRINF